VSGNVGQRLGNEKRKIEKRLKSAVAFNGGGPVLSATNIHYEMGDRSKAVSCGGIGAVHLLVKNLRLQERIDEALNLLKFHVPYHESDHVLNLAYNALCGGRTLDDIELRRNDSVFLDALGATSIPDPTTAGDFCRRFGIEDVEALQRVVNEVRVDVWKRNGSLFSEPARIDADATLVPTLGECKQGMDITFKGVWGYAPLLVSLANTGEVLFICNRSGSRPSHEDSVFYFKQAIELARKAGFTRVIIRGDTDYALTAAFDAWDDDDVTFVFGYDANATMKAWADSAPDEMYQELVRRAERAIKTKTRKTPDNVKERVVEERGFENIRLKSEDVVDFDYRPCKCKKTYRVVAVRKNLDIYKGKELQREDVRYFFYITNDRTMTCAEVVHEAMQRCNQENLIAQHKGLRALHAPLNTLNANWAYMVIVSLAWSIKAWMALLLPIRPRWRGRHAEQQRHLLRMEFRTFLAAFINIPCQIVQSGRKITYRCLAWNAWLSTFFRLINSF
jgi:hypothetical protein